MAALPTDPIDLPASGDAVLLLHGFTGSPFELRPLAERLGAAGLRVLAPLLPGHGRDAVSLGRTGLDEWLAGARDALERLVDEGHTRIFLVGFSLGGCLAILLASEHRREIAALALLAPALAFHGATRFYLDAFRVPGLSRLIPIVRKGGADLLDPVMRLFDPVLPEVPTACARELARAARAAREALPTVGAPTIVLWGAHDAVVPRAAARYAAEHVGSGPARLAVFESSAHQLALDLERDAVCAEVERFFSHFTSRTREARRS